MMELTSSIGRIKRYLMSQVARMLKDKLLSFGRNTVEPTRDGMLFILMKTRDHKRRDSTRNSDSTATDHSTWFQDSHSEELLNHMVPITLLLTDTSKEETINNGSSTALTRPSDQTTGRTTPSKSNPTVDQATSELLQQSTPDGGNSSDIKDHSLSMIKERS